MIGEFKLVELRPCGDGAIDKESVTCGSEAGVVERKCGGEGMRRLLWWRDSWFVCTSLVVHAR